jgi:DNA polymerase V
VTNLKDLVEAITEFTQRAAEKLRRQGSVAGQVAVFVHTSPFRKQDLQYSRSVVVPLRKPTADTGLLVSTAVRGMHAIYRPGYNFAKAGVHLMDLQDGSVEQGELDLDDGVQDRGELMKTLDALNQRYGRGTVAMASAGTAGEHRQWTMRQERKTPNYTTSWADMPSAIA